jgi:hypothetical protein
MQTKRQFSRQMHNRRLIFAAVLLACLWCGRSIATNLEIVKGARFFFFFHVARLPATCSWNLSAPDEQLFERFVSHFARRYESEALRAQRFQHFQVRMYDSD